MMGIYFGGAVLGAAWCAMSQNSDEPSKCRGSLGGVASLVTYNVFKNPQWFKWGRMNLIWIALLLFYGGYFNEKTIYGGVGAAYAAVLIGL